MHMASKFTIDVTVFLTVGEGAVTEMGATPNLGEICGKIVSSMASDTNRLACVSCKVVRLTNDDGGDNAC